MTDSTTSVCVRLPVAAPLLAILGLGLAGEARAQGADSCAPGPSLSGFVALANADTPVHAGDRDALIALYHAAGGEDWKDNTNWLSDRPLGDWYGVWTDDDGRVTILDLCGPGGNNLRGTIPADLGNLEKIRELRLSNNVLHGGIPPELGNLTGLRILRLSNNVLSGPAPATLARLENMWELRLHKNALTGELPRELMELPWLARLRIETNAGLCAPQDDEFQAWLATLDEFAGDCAAPASVPALPLPAVVGLALLLLGVRRRFRQRGAAS